MSSNYYENLLQTVIDNSRCKVWDLAVHEWQITDCMEDSSCSARCVCGKEKLRYLYTIYNDKTHKELFPIGSCCIKKFKRSDLDEEIKLQEQMFRLYHAMKEKKWIELDSHFFSRKLIQYLYQEGAFREALNPQQDYLFFLKMFNKRDKTAISKNQHKKINAIILHVVLPYLKRNLKLKCPNT